MENGLNKKRWVSDLVCMLPAFVFVLSILLVRLHMQTMPMTDIFWSEATDATMLTDLFTWWKAAAVIVAGCLAALIFVIGYFQGSVRFKKSFLYVPALVYAVFVLLSLVLSKYKYFALHGMNEHFEGTFVLLAYIVMVVFLANAADSERRVKMIVCCALGAALLLGILGLTQAFGHDFFSTAAGQKLITPNNRLESGMMSWDMIDLLAKTGEKAYNFAFEDGEVYQTVYNINYVPFYLTLLIPVSALGFIAFGASEEKKNAAGAAVFLIVYGILLFNFFAANSASGYFGLFAAFLAAVIVFRKNLKKWGKLLICLIVVLGLVMGVLADRWTGELKRAIGSTVQSLTTQVFADDAPQIEGDFDHLPGRTKVAVDYIETHEGYMLFSIGGNVLKISRDDAHSSFNITDEDDQPLYMRAVESEEGVYSILDERFYDYVRLSLSKDDTYTYFICTTVWTDWTFKYDGTRFLYRNKVGKELPLEPVAHSSLVRNYKAASSRGLIWATTLPILNNYIIKGSGADTFAFAYPQSDYATLYSVFDHSYLSLVTDKAHNLYMQYWVNTGLISLLAWLALVGYYLVGAAGQFRKRGFADLCDFVNGGIFCGVIGFLAVAFFNDGSVNTMPMFYTMLGTGLAINMKDKWVKTEEASGKGKKEAAMPEI